MLWRSYESEYHSLKKAGLDIKVFKYERQVNLIWYLEERRFNLILLCRYPCLLNEMCNETC